ncbi:dienelactone hydrolase family protein [Gordonia sp. CPCC 205515]|uniref:dienelactone hydrolase family protein n=1 Tax=Gordonia sp. CPCC 205515 TaxID=3140791 RepID=UPI003AF347AC
MTSEMITIDAPDGTADAYVTRPDDATGSLPGVLFIMDAIGLRPQTKKMADRIASWGYVVLAPNMFYRGGTAAELEPTADLTDPENRAAVIGRVRPLMAELTDDVAAGDLSAYIDALHALGGVNTHPIGITGYCMGGRLGLLAATTRPDDVAALGMFHTGGLVTDSSSSPHLRVAEVRADIIAIHADNDHSLPPEAVATFERALTTAGVSHSVEVYPDAAHGYTMADTSMYHHEAAERHFDELQKLFARTLH